MTAIASLPLQITALYAALVALLFIALSFRVIGYRRRDGVSIGDDGHEGLALAIRVHGNFVEYTPICLLLMLINELNGAAPLFLHLLGLLLLLGRVAHAYGLSTKNGVSIGRLSGMIMTFAAILMAAGHLFWQFISGGV